MCGNDDASSLSTVKVEGAELEVCNSCEDFGTVVESASESEEPQSDSVDSSNTTTKSGMNRSSLSTSANSGGTETSSEMNVATLLPEYGSVMEEARETAGLSVAELADELNEKESHLRQVEKEERQPTEELQQKIESFLNVELAVENDRETTDNSSSSATQTLGDMVEFSV